MKKAFLLLVVALLLLFLSACDDVPPAESTVSTEPVLYTDELTDEIYDELVNAWLDRVDITGNTVLGNPYYGRYNGYDVFFAYDIEIGKFAEPITLGEEYIQYAERFEIWVCKGGSFYSIEDAYARGILSDADVAQIAQKHFDWQFLTYPFGAQTVVWQYGEHAQKYFKESTYEDLLREGYRKLYEKEGSQLDSHWISVEFVDSYYGCHIGWVTDITYVSESHEVNIGEHTIQFPANNRLWVYRNGTMLELHEAYEAGWIDDGYFRRYLKGRILSSETMRK